MMLSSWLYMKPFIWTETSSQLSPRCVLWAHPFNDISIFLYLITWVSAFPVTYSFYSHIPSFQSHQPEGWLWPQLSSHHPNRWALIISTWNCSNSPITSAPTFSESKPDAASLTDSANQPTNLLVTFLEYSSIVMQDIKGLSPYTVQSLCLLLCPVLIEALVSSFCRCNPFQQCQTLLDYSHHYRWGNASSHPHLEIQDPEMLMMHISSPCILSLMLIYMAQCFWF